MTQLHSSNPLVCKVNTEAVSLRGLADGLVFWPVLPLTGFVAIERNIALGANRFLLRLDLSTVVALLYDAALLLRTVFV